MRRLSPEYNAAVAKLPGLLREILAAERASWKRLDDHERKHRCAWHPGSPGERSYCPLDEVLLKTWVQANDLSSSMEWLLGLRDDVPTAVDRFLTDSPADARPEWTT